MSITIKIVAPEGMSYINVFHALWKAATPNCYLYDYHPFLQKGLEKAVDTSEKVAELFEKQTFFKHVGGRSLFVDFSEFPRIDVTKYDQLHGLCAATFAFRAYAKIHPEDRLDPFDSRSFALRRERNDFEEVEEKFEDMTLLAKKVSGMPLVRITLRRKR